MVGLDCKVAVVQFINEKLKTVSHSRACKLVGLSRKRKYLKSRLKEKEEPILKAIEKATEGKRYGRGKVIAKVRRIHPDMGAYQIRRVYEKYKFSLPVKTNKRLKTRVANPITIPLKKNEAWHIDFMSDALRDGRKLRSLNVIDAFSRMCLGIEIDLSMPSRRVTRMLDQLIEQFGKPTKIRSDNGPEFTSKHFTLWLKNNKIDWDPIRPASPHENALVERFNRTYREDVLDAYLFNTLQAARNITQIWIKDYNEERPHEALGNKTPQEYAA